MLSVEIEFVRCQLVVFVCEVVLVEDFVQWCYWFGKCCWVVDVCCLDCCGEECGFVGVDQFGQLGVDGGVCIGCVDLFEYQFCGGQLYIDQIFCGGF